jgi:hypothetical protein
MRRFFALLFGATLLVAGCSDASPKQQTSPVATSSAATSTPTSTPLTPVATTAPASCKPAIKRFSSPDKKNDLILVPRGRNGFAVTIDLSCVLASDRIWLFDQSRSPDTDDPALYMDEGMSDPPSPVALGSQVAYTDTPVGDDLSDLSDEPYQLVVVVDNNHACNVQLKGTPQKDGDYKRGSVPSACAQAGMIPFTVVKY